MSGWQIVAVAALLALALLVLSYATASCATGGIPRPCGKASSYPAS